MTLTLLEQSNIKHMKFELFLHTRRILLSQPLCTFWTILGCTYCRS